MATATKDSAERLLTEVLRHRPGCPAAEGRLFGNPQTPTEFASNPRKHLGVEAYVVTGTGRYNRVTGEFDSVPRTGVVRCLECAAEELVDPVEIPAVQKAIAAQQPALQEVMTNA